MVIMDQNREGISMAASMLTRWDLYLESIVTFTDLS